MIQDRRIPLQIVSFIADDYNLQPPTSPTIEANDNIEYLAETN